MWKSLLFSSEYTVPAREICYESNDEDEEEEASGEDQDPDLCRVCLGKTAKMELFWYIYTF